jgi:hypothetical protein
MKKPIAYEEIRKLFLSDKEWNIELIELRVLDEGTSQQSIDFIIDQLNSKDASKRFVASHIIAEFKIEEAKEKLIERIKDIDTVQHNGTMAYALEHLNCKNHLMEVFEILATQSYESKMHAYSILCEQEFEFTREDIIEMKQMFESVKVNKEANQIFDEETFEMIKDGYQGFAEYLKD